MYAVSEPTAEIIGECLARFVARFGCPMTILSDDAQYFKDQAIRELEIGLGSVVHSSVLTDLLETGCWSVSIAPWGGP